MDYRTEIKRLAKLAEKKNPTAYAAICDAETNAHETEGVVADTPEFFRLQYDSICFTGEFTSDLKCQRWFARNGYEW